MKMTVQDKEALRDMTDAQFAIAGIHWNLNALPSTALQMICARYADKISAKHDCKWLTVDSEGDIFLFSLRPELGELFDTWHESVNEPWFSECTGTLKPALRAHLLLATNWRDYIVEVNQ